MAALYEKKALRLVIVSGLACACIGVVVGAATSNGIWTGVAIAGGIAAAMAALVLRERRDGAKVPDNPYMTAAIGDGGD